LKAYCERFLHIALQTNLVFADVRKKLKGDFCKAGDLLSIISLENELNTIASKLFDCLPPVMQAKLLTGADGCRCRFNIRTTCKSELHSLLNCIIVILVSIIIIFCTRLAYLLSNYDKNN